MGTYAGKRLSQLQCPYRVHVLYRLPSLPEIVALLHERECKEAVTYMRPARLGFGVRKWGEEKGGVLDRAGWFQLGRPSLVHILLEMQVIGHGIVFVA